MKLAISNIAWTAKQDETIYGVMKKHDFTGLEIAPTRIFPVTPYKHLRDATEWAESINKRYGFVIPSMQSIWDGRTENIFASEEDRSLLVSYTKMAIDFAETIGCLNLVFGCPRNRTIPKGKTSKEAINFFREIASYAVKKGTVVGMEANPSIYNTNFINDTEAAIQLVKEVDSMGFRLNLDVGTMIYNKENLDILKGNVWLINHVHISEPGLKPIAKRQVHDELYKVLKEEEYDRFVSIEMEKNESIDELEKTIDYVRKIFA